MKVIVGLGNPGREYAKTKHNVGFMAVDYILEHIGLQSIQKTNTKFNAIITESMLDNNKVLFAKPLTYMNLSGQAVKQISDWYKIDIDDLLIIYDDLDLPLGKVRIREKGSSGGHNGIKSIIQHIGTEKFKRVKIGIDHPTDQMVTDYVLTKFSKPEKKLIDESLDIVRQAIIEWIKEDDFKKVMSSYQTKK